MIDAAIGEIDSKVQVFVSCITDSENDVKDRCDNFARDRGVQGDWYATHLVKEVCKHALGTSAAHSNSKNPDVLEVIQMMLKVVEM